MLPVYKYTQNTVVFREGDDQSKAMYIVVEGSVKVYVERDGEDVELARLGKGEIFGEMAMYRNRPRSACVKTLENSRLCVIKTRLQLEQFIKENPAFVSKMMVILCERLATMNDCYLEKVGHPPSHITLTSRQQLDSEDGSNEGVLSHSFRY